jgi:hypothetical protein
VTIGGVITSVQFAVVKSAFSCNTKSPDGIIQEMAVSLPAATMYSRGDAGDCDAHIPPKLSPANNLFPSAEEATQFQLAPGALVVVHVAPESLEIQIGPTRSAFEVNGDTATKVMPSAEEATEFQWVTGAVVNDQFVPASVET